MILWTIYILGFFGFLFYYAYHGRNPVYCAVVSLLWPLDLVFAAILLFVYGIRGGISRWVRA